jgi:recombination protein RecA
VNTDRTETTKGYISSGSTALDQAIVPVEFSGYPAGRVVEIFGPKGVGKTTLALHAIASCQAAGGAVAFVDADQSINLTYARRAGVQIDDLLVSQPDSAEQALALVESLAASGAVALVVVDSVEALVPRTELDGGTVFAGTLARLLSQALRRLTAIASRTGCCVLFINHLEKRVGSNFTFGPLETTSGGNALKYYACVRIDVRCTGELRSGGEVVGHRLRARVVKNKISPPFRQAELQVLFDAPRSTQVVDVVNVAAVIG